MIAARRSRNFTSPKCNLRARESEHCPVTCLCHVAAPAARQVWLSRPRRSVSRTSRHVRPEACTDSCPVSGLDEAAVVERASPCSLGASDMPKLRSSLRVEALMHPAVPGAGGCPLHPVKPSFHIHIHTCLAASGLCTLAIWLVSPSLSSSSSSCQEKQQVCRLRGFRSRGLTASLLLMCHLLKFNGTGAVHGCHQISSVMPAHLQYNVQTLA